MNQDMGEGALTARDRLETREALKPQGRLGSDITGGAPRRFDDRRKSEDIGRQACITQREGVP